MIKRTAAVMVTALGQINPYTCQSSIQQCLEFCEENVLAWDKHLEIGATIAIVEITVVKTYTKEQLAVFKRN